MSIRINGIRYDDGKLEVNVKKDSEMPHTDFEMTNKDGSIVINVKEKFVNGGGGDAIVGTAVVGTAIVG